MVSLLLLHRRLRNLTLKKLVIVLILSVASFNEFLVYTYQSYRWPSIPKYRDSGEDMVILLISDPQLIGIQDELGFPIGPMARWDSDNYLRKTFSRVYHHTLPDVIVFLGDIMDEGSKATDYEYETYVQRFNNIFYEKKYAKTIVIPGDNDIGGEGGDFRTPFKVGRFERYFENLTGVVTQGFIDFLKLDNQRAKDLVLETKKLLVDVAGQLKSPYRIIVNHESMITKHKGSVYPFLRIARPNIIFTGHWHVSQMFTCDTCLADDDNYNNWPYHPRDISKMVDFIDVEFNSEIALSEIMVPTCSYRMGVPNMGYGVAVINKSGQMKYTVMWLPARYTLLYIYIVMLVIVTFLLLLDFICSPTRKDFYR